MHPSIKISHDSVRGCGWRDQEGAIYLVSDGPGMGCGKLPIFLAHACECCGQLIYDVVIDGKPLLRSRSYRKLDDPAPMLNSQPCENNRIEGCLEDLCPLFTYPPNQPALFEWVGEKHYPTTAYFTREAEEQGISRRIRALPDWFEVGKTWVLLAHGTGMYVVDNMEWNKAHPAEQQRPEQIPAIFYMYRPTRVEVIVHAHTRDEVIDDYVDRGLTPVLVVRTNDRGKELCTICNEEAATHKEIGTGAPVCELCYIGF